MNSIRKWLYKPKKTDQSLLAKFFYSDEDLNTVAGELDSFDGRKDPERCTTLVNQLRQCQDKVLSICQMIMDEVIPEDRAPRDFRAKFPDDVLQENLAGQLWFGAECLSAGSNILNRELESASMRPLAKALTKSLENVRNLLREQCFKSPPEFTEKICESLKILDRLFAEFELSYVSAMVPVKSVHEYEAQQGITVLFSETLQRSLKLGLLSQDQVDSCDPALMFTIPRLAIVAGLLVFPKGPLCLDQGDLSDMFRPFRSLLLKIRELLWTLNRSELWALERALCSVEETYVESRDLDTEQDVLNNRNFSEDLNVSRNNHNSHTHHHHFHRHHHHHHLNQHNNCQSQDQISSSSDEDRDAVLVGSHSIQDYLDQLYKDFPQCKDFITDLCHSSGPNSSNQSPHAGGEEGEDTLDQSSAKEAASADNNDTYHSPPPQYSLIENNSLSDPYSVSTPSSTRNEQAQLLSSPARSSPSRRKSNQMDPTKKSSTTSSSSRLNKSSSTSTTASDFCKSVKTKTVKQAKSPHDEWEGVVVEELGTEVVGGDPHDAWFRSCDDIEIAEGIIDEDQSENNVRHLETVAVDCSSETLPASSSSRDSGLSSMAESSTILDNIPKAGGPNSSNHHRAIVSGTSSGEISPSVPQTPQLLISFDEQDQVCPEHTGQVQDQGHGSRDCCTSSSPKRIDQSNCDFVPCFESTECQDDMEIALAMQAAEIASRNEVRARFKNSSDLIHRLFICISGVADQLQTNYAADLRSTLKCVFAMNATPSDSEEENASLDDGSCGENSGIDVTPEPSLGEEHSVEAVNYIPSDSEGQIDNIQAETQERHDNHYHHQHSTVEQHSTVMAPAWVPDELAPQCMACAATFTVVRRRHHCRNCGKVFCGKCSGNSVPLPRFGHLKPVRVCNRCFMYSVTPFTLPVAPTSTAS